MACCGSAPAISLNTWSSTAPVDLIGTDNENDTYCSTTISGESGAQMTIVTFSEDGQPLGKSDDYQA